MEPILAVSFDAPAARYPVWQVTQRVQWVVTQVAKAFAGKPETEIAQELTQRLRGMGVPPNERDVARFAQSIAALKNNT